MSGEIQSVARSLAIIEYLSDSTKAQHLKDIAVSCSLPLATTHRLLNNLCSLGYIKHESNGRYQLSYKLLEIANKHLSRSSLIPVAKSFLDNLSEQLDESVHLVAREGNDIIYVYKVSRVIGSIQLASRVGKKLPLYCCGVGKAILSTLDDTEIKNIFNTTKIIPAGPNTITDFDQFMEEIKKTRLRGYAVDNEENEEGIKCVAVPLVCRQENVSYAFSVSSLKSRIPDERVPEIAEVMLKIKTQIEKLML